MLTGWGFVRQTGASLEAVAAGRLSLRTKEPMCSRLAGLAAELDALLDAYQPDAAVLESLFHGINPRSLIVLAQARGALLAVLGRRRITAAEYSPAEIKGAVTGNGRADKTQVARMVKLLLSLGDERRAADVTDALAVAICFAQRHRMDRLEARLGGR
jgi:crossover junction endodeoxyribonuclease RuvC